VTDPRGFYDKYRVTRTDGTDEPGQKHHGCTYFVLDLVHDEVARSIVPVLADAYAAAGLDALARDLRAIPAVLDLVKDRPAPPAAVTGTSTGPSTTGTR